MEGKWRPSESGMIEKQLLLEGSSISGRRLQVKHKGDGILFSSFEIERNSDISSGTVSLALFLFPVSTALCKDLLLFNHCTLWTVGLLTIVFSAIWLTVICSYCRESVLVVKDLGVQYTRFGLCGIQATQFVEHHKVLDVVINEAVTMHQVVFYLTLLTNNPAKDEKGNFHQLIPLFTVTMPRLETITPIYHGMQQILHQSSKQREECTS